MESEGDTPLLIFGTPLGNWYPLADSIRKAAGSPEANPYGDWHRELFGVQGTEFQVGISRGGGNELEIPMSLKSEMQKLAKEVAPNTRLIGASAYGCWTADSWLEAIPTAKGLVFYEHPAPMISRYLSADPSASVETLVSIWSTAVLKILSVVRRHRDRVYLLNGTECVESEHEYLQWMRKHLGMVLDGAEVRRRPDEDPILRGLVEVLCSQNSSITKLFQELEASAQPIDHEWDSAASEQIEKSSLVALEELLALRRDNSGLAEKNSENERTILRLENVIENHQSLVFQKQKENLGIVETLFGELHQAFEESEGFFADWKKAESTRRELCLKVEAVIRGDAKEDSEHRHLNYTFQNATLLGRQWSMLHLRLVHHLGHAGIAFFSANDSTTLPIESWEPTGSENDIPFWLFVPTDEPARHALRQASTRDWALVTDSVSLVLSDLRENGPPENSRSHWGHVAERLQAELNGLPERLRYDSVLTVLNPAEDSEALCFEIVNASFRERVFSSLKFTWSSSLLGGRLSLNLSDADCPPLSYWPETTDGKFVDSLDFAYSKWKVFAGKDRQVLDKLTKRDKAFLQAVLSEIPHFLVHASRQHPTSAVVSKHLQKYGGTSSQKNVEGAHVEKPFGYFE
jgi:hypothetical protein